MKDFDFEELDRAVHSATSQEVEEEADVAPRPEPVPSPAARRTSSSGRFMDVMHPSSDMRQSGPAPLPRTPAPTETPSVDDEPVQAGDDSASQSPFIPDAVVEKRPLGTAAPLDLFQEPEHELLEEHYEDTPEVEPASEPAVQPVEEVATSTEVTETHRIETPQPQTSPVFDTETYHPPAPQVKKRSGAWVILWIFLLILLGAGAGAGVYFFVLPLL